VFSQVFSSNGGFDEFQGVVVAKRCPHKGRIVVRAGLDESAGKGMRKPLSQVLVIDVLGTTIGG
jgi:hypothetical protein